MRITEVQFELITGATSETVIPQEEFNGIMGGYAINGVPVTSRWVPAQDSGGADGATLVTVDVRGRIMRMFYVTQPVSAYATGIPG